VKANEAQESAQWLMDRCGAFTASRAGDLMARTKSGPSASRAALLAQLAVERITGQPVEGYRNAAMERGMELEAEGRDAYSFATGNAVQECGFISHPTLPYCGASPDGLIDPDGLVEIKCPANMARHLDALRDGSNAKEYRWQLQHQLMVTGRKWVDIVSYDPRYPSHLQLAIVRVLRDQESIDELMEAVTAANEEVEQIVLELNTKKVA